MKTTEIKKTPVQVLSSEFCKFFKNPFWQYNSGRLLLNFFYSLNCLLPPSELIETRFFSIFEHVLSRISNIMNIKNFISRNRRPSCSYWETDILLETRSEAVFFKLINLSAFIHAYSVSVLGCPVILYLKFKETATNVIHWVRGVI